MIAAARLAWRMQRWELLVLVGGSLLLAVVMALVAWQVTVTTDGLETCYGGAPSAPLAAGCRSLVEWGNLMTTLGQILPTIAVGLPFVVGILLGAPLVAREIEKRTAPMAWSLSRSRRRWLAGRLVPVLLAVTVALLAVGAASEGLLVASRPEPSLGFADHGFHGPLIAARGLAVLVMGVFVGLLLGRVLPAILVTGLLTIGLLTGLYVVRDQTMRAEATWVEVPADGGAFAMIYDSGFTDRASGEFVTYEQAYERFPEAFGPEGSGMPVGLTQVYLTTPPELYPVFVAREIGALAVVTALVGGAAAWAIARRRPE
jgi:hypothetical protein